MEIQLSILVPPQADSIIPIGTFNFSKSDKPKIYPIAVNLFADVLLDTSHLPPVSKLGLMLAAFGLLNKRIFLFTDFLNIHQHLKL